MKNSTKQIFISATLTALTLLLVVVGYLMGRYSISNEFKTQIDGVAHAFYLGNLLDNDKKKGAAKAYHDSAEALELFDDISWGVLNVPTPYVGTAPMPGQYGVAHVNSMQFRSSNELEIPKPKNTFRIFITGGSTAYGSGAPSDDRTIAGYLIDLIENSALSDSETKYEIFTMANPAWSSTHERIVIENRLSELQADLVISFSGNNDVHWGLYAKDIFWFRSYPDENIVNTLNTAYKLGGGESIPKVVEITSGLVAPKIVASRLLKNVKLSSFVLAESQAKYVFVLQPTLAVTAKALTEREKAMVVHADYFRQSYAQIDQQLTSYRADNFEYINLAGAFDTISNKENVFVDSYHFGDKGNEIIANGIYKGIKRLLINNVN